jgi:hypothetical protein
MKTIILFLLIGFSFLFSWNQSFGQDIALEGDITQDLSLTSNNTYLLKGYVRVFPPATLRIEAGTTIYSGPDYSGTLVIKSGAKILAEGTKQQPIIFTSVNNRGDSGIAPQYGDWGGIIILGNAPINVESGSAIIEGAGDSYGGSNPNDSSGIMRYVRIEYCGQGFYLNHLPSSLTLAGVGNKTIIDFVQSTYAGKDAFTWYGGTVNCKNLVSYKSRDDDFDFDFGYQGKLQFLLCIRDRDIADVNVSNGFESDNDGSGSLNEPRTSPTIYNATIIGPVENTQTIYNEYYENGMDIRRSSQGVFCNILLMGWPTGLLVDGKTIAQDAQNSNWALRNSIISGSRNKDLDTIRTDGTFDITTWFTDNDNRIVLTNEKVKLTAPYDTVEPNYFPQPDSPVLIEAAIPPDDGFFDTTANYVGAFKENNWLEGWTKLDYDINTSVDELEKVPEGFMLYQNYPNPFNPVTTIMYQIPKDGFVNLKIYDILGSEVTTLVHEFKKAGKYETSLSVIEVKSNLASGTYIYRLTSGSYAASKKFLILK